MRILISSAFPSVARLSQFTYYRYAPWNVGVGRTKTSKKPYQTLSPLTKVKKGERLAAREYTRWRCVATTLFSLDLVYFAFQKSTAWEKQVRRTRDGWEGPTTLKFAAVTSKNTLFCDFVATHTHTLAQL